MMEDVAHLSSVEHSTTAAIKNKVDFDSITPACCSPHYHGALRLCCTFFPLPGGRLVHLRGKSTHAQRHRNKMAAALNEWQMEERDP
jgi:hypothetical protein